MNVVPRISVVIPVYNRESTIRDAINSVLRQSWQDFEIIVVDDGSTDGTLAAAARITDPRLRLVESPQNGGAAAARNAGIREARAEWVAFQDSDDEWLPAKLEKQMTRLLAPGADHIAVYCGMLIWGGAVGFPAGARKRRKAGQRVRMSYLPSAEIGTVEGDLLDGLLRGNFISTQTLVVRRDLLNEMGGFDTTLPAVEDWDCALRLAGLGPIACVDEPLVIQRFSPNSLSLQIGRRLAARDLILDKHAALYAGRRDLLGRLHSGQATAHARNGNPQTARASLARARRLCPLSPRVWALHSYLALLGWRHGTAPG